MTALERLKRVRLKKEWRCKNPKKLNTAHQAAVPIRSPVLAKNKKKKSWGVHGSEAQEFGRRRCRTFLSQVLRRRQFENEPPEAMVHISARSKLFMQAAVFERLAEANGHSCTLFDVVQALKSSDKVINSLESNDGGGGGGGRGGSRLLWNRWRRHDGPIPLRRKYLYMWALDDIESKPSACDDRIKTWEEVEEALREHFNFAVKEDESSDHPVRRLSRRIESDEMDKIKANFIRKSPKFAQGAEPPFLAEYTEKEEDKAEQFADGFDGALENAEKLAGPEEAALEEDRIAEAEERATQLLRELTPEEQEMVRNALFDIGPEDDIVAQSDTNVITRKNMHTLQPGAWLSDEVIHYFLAMLAVRDQELCLEDSDRKRSHFFKSFFMTKLTNEGHHNPEIAGTYEYRNVKRWSKKVPGKDIFQLDKIIFPINVGEVHWVCAVAFMQEKRIQYYDSFVSKAFEACT